MKFAMKFVTSIFLLALCVVEAQQHERHSGKTYDMNEECDADGWVDADGYNCTWYDEHNTTGACTEDYAIAIGSDNMNAQMACCACEAQFHAGNYTGRTGGREHGEERTVGTVKAHNMYEECDPDGWKDVDGYNCTWYTEQPAADQVCKQDYALVIGDDNMNAVQACCACEAVFDASNYTGRARNLVHSGLKNVEHHEDNKRARINTGA